jgi:hypothetical protein
MSLLIEHSPSTGQRLHRADEIQGIRVQTKGKLSPTIPGHLGHDLAHA